MTDRARSPQAVKSPPDSQQVETEGAQRKRSGSRGTVRRIQRTARERQAAWLEGGRPNETYRLTRDLDYLYDEHRDEQAGTFTVPYYGRISGVCSRDR